MVHDKLAMIVDSARQSLAVFLSREHRSMEIYVSLESFAGWESER